MKGVRGNLFFKKVFPGNSPSLTLQILAQGNGAADDAGDDAESDEAEQDGGLDLREGENGDHLKIRHDHLFNVGIDVPFHKIGDNGGEKSDDDAFENERQGDEPARRADIAHDADFMPSRKHGQLDRVDDDEYADRRQNRKEPYENQHNAALHALDARRKVETVVDLHDPFDLVKLIVQFPDLFGVHIGNLVGIRQRIVFFRYVVIHVVFLLHLRQTFSFRNPPYGCDVVEFADLLTDRDDFFFGRFGITEDDDFVQGSELFKVEVDVRNDKREASDNDQTAHQDGDRYEAHDAVAPESRKRLSDKVENVVSSHWNIPPTWSSTIRPSFSMTTRCL